MRATPLLSFTKTIWLLPLSGVSAALLLKWVFFAWKEAARDPASVEWAWSALSMLIFPLINTVLIAALLPKGEWRRRWGSILFANLFAAVVFLYVFMLFAFNTVGS